MIKSIQIGNKTFAMAQAWRDCSLDQIQTLLPLQLVPIPAEPGQAAILKYAAAKVLIQAPEKLLERLDETQKWRLMRLAAWVFRDRIESKPFDSFTFQGVTYLLPERFFTTSPAIEVAMANMYYMAYTRKENPDLAAVFALVATLCRPVRRDLQTFKTSADWNNDSREIYNGVVAEDRANVFKEGALAIGIVMAVLQYFEYSNNSFLKTYKPVYSAGDEEVPLYTDGRGLITTFMDIAETGRFGDFENVCKQPAHTIWLWLQDNSLKVKRANDRAEAEREE